MKDLIEKGQVVRGWLGIEAQQLSPQLAQSLNVSSSNGVIITAVYNQGPAYQAGLRPGDVITHINQLPIGDGRQGMQQIASAHPGDKVVIRMIRQSQTQELTAILGSKPQNDN